MIKFNNVTLTFGEKTAINNFTLTVKNGERICLFGESGAGKSSVLKVIAGIYKAQNTEIEDQKISMVFQNDRLLKNRSALYNVALISNEETAKELLCALNLCDNLSTKCELLSGGMARRVAIARALAANFDTLLLDEPFTGLDDENKAITANLINEKTKGKTVILVSHDRHEADLLNCKIVEM